MASMEVKQWALQLTETMTVSFVEEYGRRQDTQADSRHWRYVAADAWNVLAMNMKEKLSVDVYIVHVYRIR
jgi:hypothetical protein